MPRASSEPVLRQVLKTSAGNRHNQFPARCLPQSSLTNQRDDTLRKGIRLSEHRGTDLCKDLVLGERCRFLGDINITYTAFRRTNVIFVRPQTFQRVGQPALLGSYNSALGADIVNT